MTRMTVGDLVRSTAEFLSRSFGASADRTQAILLKILQARYRRGAPLHAELGGDYPELCLLPSIKEAILFMGPSKALRFFESCDDFEDLYRRESGVRDWAMSSAILSDRPGLCQILNEFIHDQRDGREYLVSTGYPCFVSRSAWFREYVGELYPVRYAIVRATIQRSDGRLVCDWGWGKNAFRSEPRPEGWLPQPPETCDYADSPGTVGLATAEVERIEKLRPLVLDLKIKIFEIYRDALSGASNESPWGRCRELLKQELSYDDAKFLLEIDRRLGGENVNTGMLPRPIEGWPPGGLSCILESVVLLETELRSRLISEIYDALYRASLIAPGPFERGRSFLTIYSYYETIGRPAQDVLDQCLDRFLGLRDAPEPDYGEVRRMIQETLREDLGVEIVLARLVPKKLADTYERTMGSLLDAELESLVRTGRFMTVPTEIARPSSDAALDAGANVFRRNPEGSWTITFGGSTIHPKDSVGLQYICELLRRPGKPISARELHAAVRGGRVDEASTPLAEDLTDEAGEDSPPAMKTVHVDSILDPERRVEIQNRLAQLQEQRKKAVELGDLDRAQALDGESAKLEDYLMGTVGSRGRERRFSSKDERCRKRVTVAISSAKKLIGASHPDLGRHLKYIRTGRTCSYEPQSSITWEF